MELPTDIMNLIMQYKEEMEEHDQWMKFLALIFSNLLYPGFVI